MILFLFLSCLFLFSIISIDVCASQNKFNIKVNINKATVEELQRIPGIGEVLAKRIIEYRNKTGGFKSIEELKNVKGIGEKKLEAIRPYITLEDPAVERGSTSSKDVGESNGKARKIFQYIDERGVIHYTQFPEQVPDKYRSTLKEIR